MLYPEQLLPGADPSRCLKSLVAPGGFAHGSATTVGTPAGALEGIKSFPTVHASANAPIARDGEAASAARPPPNPAGRHFQKPRGLDDEHSERGSRLVSAASAMATVVKAAAFKALKTQDFLRQIKRF